jgi:large subunit ribosomal protein L25
MADYTLSAEVRTKLGKGDSKKLRAAGRVPAVIYGKDVNPTHVSLERRLMEKTFRKANRNAIFEIELSNNEKKEVIVRDFQKHAISHLYTHVDFQAITMDQPVKVDVELKFVGTPVGKKLGGIFTSLCKKIRVEALPNKIPEIIELNIDDLEAGTSLHVSDIKVGDYSIVTSPKIALCQVSKVKEEEEATAEEGEAAAPAAEA